MTPEELDWAIGREALRICEERPGGLKFGELARTAARLAREGWTPPEPVDPDVLAFREWMDTNPLKPRPATEQNRYDSLLCEVFVQGARMAREQAQERTNPLVVFADQVRAGVFIDLDEAKRHAAKVIAAYKAGKAAR